MRLLWAISFILIYLVSVHCSSPTATPTYSATNENLVEFSVQVRLKNVQSSSITWYEKDVMVAAIKQSLVCCDQDFSVVITGYYSGAAVSARK